MEAGLLQREEYFDSIFSSDDFIKYTKDSISITYKKRVEIGVVTIWDNFVLFALRDLDQIRCIIKNAKYYFGNNVLVSPSFVHDGIEVFICGEEQIIVRWRGKKSVFMRIGDDCRLRFADNINDRYSIKIRELFINKIINVKGDIHMGNYHLLNMEKKYDDMKKVDLSEFNLEMICNDDNTVIYATGKNSTDIIQIFNNCVTFNISSDFDIEKFLRKLGAKYHYGIYQKNERYLCPNYSYKNYEILIEGNDSFKIFYNCGDSMALYRKNTNDDEYHLVFTNECNVCGGYENANYDAIIKEMISNGILITIT